MVKAGLGRALAGGLLVALVAADAVGGEDARTLLLKVVENQEHNEDLQRQYVYLETITTEHLDGEGRVRRRESESAEVTPTIDGEYKRRVARNGRPLSASESGQEEQRLREHGEKQRRLSAAERDKAREKLKRRTDRFKTRLREALEVYDFAPLPDETADGRMVRVFDFQPKPGYRPRSRATTVLKALQGRIWIDPEQAQITRLHLTFREDFSLLGGIFGRVSRGSEASARQARSPGGVWLLDQVTLRLQARLYFLKRYHRTITAEYSDYRRFRVETEEGDFRPVRVKP